MIACPSCGEPIADTNAACASCGAPNPAFRRRGGVDLIVRALIGAVVFVALIWLALWAIGSPLGVRF